MKSKAMKNLNSFRILRKSAGLACFLINKDIILPSIEQNLIFKKDTELSEVRPIFIIGAPRTGSTLLYQLLVGVYKSSYFSNLASLLFKSPVLATKITYTLGLRYKFSGDSTYGYIKGVCAPSEAGPIYNYWFGQPIGDYGELVNPEIPRYTIKKIMDIMGGPFISKNLNNSLRIKQIRATFPEAVFLYMKREPIYVAQSIIVTRRKFLGSDQAWFSVRPPGYEQLLNLSPFEQVVWQIKLIEECIEKAISELDIKNVIETSYDHLCPNWRQELDYISMRCERYGVTLKEKNSLDIRLENSDKQILTDADWERLTYILKHIYGSSNY